MLQLIFFYKICGNNNFNEHTFLVFSLTVYYCSKSISLEFGLPLFDFDFKMINKSLLIVQKF